LKLNAIFLQGPYWLVFVKRRKMHPINVSRPIPQLAILPTLKNVFQCW